MNLQPVDWFILAAFFVFFLGMAVYINRRCRSVADYLVSARKVRMWLGIGAGIAGEIGLVSIAAMCEQGFLRGFSFTLIIILSTAITLPLFGIFGFGIERFRATRCMSVPQYVEMRYSRNLRVVTGMFNCLAGVLQMCIFPIIGAMFLKVMLGAPDAAQIGGLTIRTEWLLMATLLVCNVIFTYFGGYITLTVTNFFMMILIMGAITWLLWHAVGSIGLEVMWRNLEEDRGVAAFYSFAEGSYGPLWFVWLMTMSILLQFSYGPYLQKYASLDKPKTVSRSYLLGSIFGNGRTFMIIGLGVVALSAMGPAPPAGLAVDESTWSKIATPYYLAQHTPAVLMGFWIACLVFADISTTDQYLLSWSTSIVNDCILPFRRKPLGPRPHIMAVRATIVVLCVVFFVVGVFYTPTLPIWEFLWLLANIIGGTGIAVIFGMYWRRANTPGAYAAVLTNLLLPLTDLTARWVYKANGWEYPLPPEVTGFGTYLLGVVLLVVVSLLTPDEGKFRDLGQAVREQNRAEAVARAGGADA